MAKYDEITVLLTITDLDTYVKSNYLNINNGYNYSKSLI